MKGLHFVSLLFIVVAAGTISACADGTAPTPTSRSSVRYGLLAPGNVTTVDMPGATATVLFGINDDGAAVGRYASAGSTHGLLRSATGQLTTIDFPGAGFTVAGGLNDLGDIVGWYTLPAAPAIRHGFLLRAGVFTSFDPPGSIFTNALGINDRGDIVGRYCVRNPCREPGNGDFHGFLRRPNGEFIKVDVPGSPETNAWTINDRGEILGGYGVSKVQLFLRRNGQYSTMALPNGKALAEDRGGFNALGDIVGKYCDASPCLIGPTGHGFVISDGRLSTIDVPGAFATGAFAINVSRAVVGGYYDAALVLHGYVMQLEQPPADK